MLFSEGVSLLKDAVKKTDISEGIQAQLKSALNSAKIEVSKAFHWKQLTRHDELVVIPYYKTGTATWTQDSRTVLGNGTAWTTAMIGRYFKPQDSGNWYKVTDVDASAQTLTLRSAITEESASGTYRLWKRFYRVNSDIRLILPDEKDLSLPLPLEVNGYDLESSAYQTGTVTLTENSDEVVGVGTAFMDNVFPGDYLEIEAERYWVKSVKSDTKLVLTNLATLGITSSAEKPYKIYSESPYVAEMAGSDDIENKLIPYRYIRHLYPMVNDSDTTELSNSFDQCILDFAKAGFGRTVNSTTWASDLNLAQARLETLKMNKDLAWYPVRMFSPTVRHGNGRGLRY